MSDLEPPYTLLKGVILEEELIIEEPQEEIIEEEVSLIQSIIDVFNKFDEEEVDKEVDTSIITQLCDLIRTKDTIRRLASIEDLDNKFAKAFYNYKVFTDSKKDYDKLYKILMNMHSNMCVDYFEDNLAKKEVVNG